MYMLLYVCAEEYSCACVLMFLCVYVDGYMYVVMNILVSVRSWRLLYVYVEDYFYMYVAVYSCMYMLMNILMSVCRIP
jgi:hypothetical protein